MLQVNELSVAEFLRPVRNLLRENVSVDVDGHRGEINRSAGASGFNAQLYAYGRSASAADLPSTVLIAGPGTCFTASFR